MVRVTEQRPYVLHISSEHRSPLHSSGEYTVGFEAIRCEEHQSLKATLLSARIPASVYYLDKETDRTITVRMNVSSVGGTDFAREVTVLLSPGSYTLSELLTEVKEQLNAACTTAHASTNFVTSLRTGRTEQSTHKTPVTRPSRAIQTPLWYPFQCSKPRTSRLSTKRA